MSDNNDIENIDSKLKAITGIEPGGGFAVPDGYFETFSAELFSKINDSYVESEPNINGLKNQWPSKTPDGYFENLQSRIITRIEEEEIKDEQLLEKYIKYLPAEEIYNVPTAYFETSRNRILAKIDQPSVAEIGSGKIKSIRTQRIYRIYRATAVAALLAIAFGIGWMISGDKTIPPAKTLAEVTVPSHQPYIKADFSRLNQEELEQALRQTDVSEELIVQYVDLKDEPVKESIKLPPAVKQSAVQKLENLSKEEIEKYMNEHGNESIIIDEL